jgi:hypothetical protein
LIYALRARKEALIAEHKRAREELRSLRQQRLDWLTAKADGNMAFRWLQEAEAKVDTTLLDLSIRILRAESRAARARSRASGDCQSM